MSQHDEERAQERLYARTRWITREELERLYPSVQSDENDSDDEIVLTDPNPFKYRLTM